MTSEHGGGGATQCGVVFYDRAISGNRYATRECWCLVHCKGEQCDRHERKTCECCKGPMLAAGKNIYSTTGYCFRCLFAGGITSGGDPARVPPLAPSASSRAATETSGK